MANRPEYQTESDFSPASRSAELRHPLRPVSLVPGLPAIGLGSPKRKECPAFWLAIPKLIASIALRPTSN